MQQGKPIGAYSSAVPPPGLKPCGSYPASSYPTVSYSCHHYQPLYSAPIPHSTGQLHPDQRLTMPSDGANDSRKYSQPLPTLPTEIFRPVDFENPNGANCFPPTPPDSEFGDGDTGGITVLLADKALWESFLRVGNEMIVTKPGRRLFPATVLSVRGLNPRADYSISLRVVPADKFRYKYLNMQWARVAESEVLQNESRQVFLHPSSPNSGEFWMRKPISFKTVKITHNSSSTNGNILLYTMHKYQLQLEVRPAEKDKPFKIGIPETTFLAVTSYQNNQLTQLKIDNNPFAKGFRDRDMAIPPPPINYNRPILPLWQMPPLPLPYPPLPSMPPPEVDPENPGSNRSSPDIAPENGSPAQQGDSHYPQHPMLSYPLPYPCLPWVYGLPPPPPPDSTGSSSSYSSPFHGHSCPADCSDVEDEH